MSEPRVAAGPLPAAPYLKLPEHGDPYLVGSSCGSCDARFLGERSVCARCGARDKMQVRRLSNHGTLHAFTIVHRSFPGVAVPYVSAIVDLADGVSIKGNLTNIAADPEQITFGMPVEVIYGDALGRKDRDGNSYVSYFFQPATSSGQ
jgi:uncharacterized OB-fold protein